MKKIYIPLFFSFFFSLCAFGQSQQAASPNQAGDAVTSSQKEAVESSTENSAEMVPLGMKANKENSPSSAVKKEEPIKNNETGNAVKPE